MEPNWAQAFANARRIVSVEEVLGLRLGAVAAAGVPGAPRPRRGAQHLLLRRALPLHRDLLRLALPPLARRLPELPRRLPRGDGDRGRDPLALSDGAAAPRGRRARGHAADALRDRHRLADLVGALEPGRRGALAARRLRARGRDRDDPLRALATSCGSRARSTRRSSCSRSSSPATTSCSTRSPECSCSRSASCSSEPSAAAAASNREPAPPEARALAKSGGLRYNRRRVAGWSSQVARRAHNPEVAGSNPAPATESPALRGFPVRGRRSATACLGQVFRNVP